MRNLNAWAPSMLAGALLIAFVGCSESGPPKHVVKGQISDGGKVIPVKENETKSGEKLRVWLRDAVKGGDTYEAMITIADGTFTIAGGDGRGVPQGKYKVFVEWKDKFPVGNDLLKGKFNEANSKIIRDIPPPDGMLKIDVSKPEG